LKESEIRNSRVHDKYLDLVRQDAESLLRHNDHFMQTNCPICLSEDLIDEFIKFGFGYQTCSSCHTLFVNPRPSLELLEDFYAHSESSRFWITEFFLPMVEPRRTKIFHPRAQQIVNLLSLRQGGSVGDVGAGYGIFLEELRILRPDLKLVSIEPSPEMAEICRSKEFQVLEGVVENVRGFDGEFDLLCSFELFEHLHSPVEMVNAVFRLLRPGGVFYMTTLNGLGFDVLWQWEKSKSIFPPHHLNFSNPKALSDLFIRQGFEVLVADTPGCLDWDIMEGGILAERVDGGRFWNHFAQRGDSVAKEQLQQWISTNNMSSHMRMIVRKPAS